MPVNLLLSWMRRFRVQSKRRLILRRSSQLLLLLSLSSPLSLNPHRLNPQLLLFLFLHLHQLPNLCPHLLRWLTPSPFLWSGVGKVMRKGVRVTWGRA